MKTKLLAILFILIIPVAGYIFMACDGEPGTGSTEGQIEFQFDTGAFTCASGHDGLHQLEFEIAVNSVNPQTGTQEQIFFQLFESDNNVFGRRFSTMVTAGGTYQVIVRARSSECYNCCAGAIPSGCSQSGRPTFTAEQVFPNYSGLVMLITLGKAHCNCC